MENTFVPLVAEGSKIPSKYDGWILVVTTGAGFRQLSPRPPTQSQQKKIIPYNPPHPSQVPDPA